MQDKSTATTTTKSPADVVDSTHLLLKVGSTITWWIYTDK
jgi:hypothetical protein